MAQIARRSVLMILLATAGVAGADSFREQFDQAGGGTVAPTRFSVALLSLNGGIAREPTAPGLGVPSTGGVLPVDEGGDSELRFFEAAVPAGSSYVLTAETSFADVEVEAYVAIGFVEAFGTRSASLLVRVEGATAATLDAYAVVLNHVAASEANLVLGRVTDGVTSPWVTSASFPVSPASENYRLTLRAFGSSLAAGVLRVEEVGGQRVETPIDLDASPGLQSELTAVDASLSAGAIGLRAFTRASNSVLFDDVTVLERLFADGFETGDTSAWSATSP